MLKLTLADFTTALPFSTHIEERQIQPFVDLSLRLDIVPLLGWPVLEAVAALPSAVPAPYDPATPYTAGAYVVRRQRVYRALVDLSGATPPAAAIDPAQWAYQPLLTLWSQYLQPYWLRASYGRFLAEHGTTITKAGMTQPNDPQGTFVRAPSADRAALQAAADSTTEALRSQLTAFRQAEQAAYGKSPATGYDYGLATTSCCAGPSTPRTRLRGINSSRRPLR